MRNLMNKSDKSLEHKFDESTKLKVSEELQLELEVNFGKSKGVINLNQIQSEEVRNIFLVWGRKYFK